MTEMIQDIFHGKSCTLFKSSYEELTQNKVLVHKLVSKILNSRLLLIDHVECLESFHSELTQSLVTSESFTLTHVSALLLCSAILRNTFLGRSPSIKLMGVVALGGYSACYAFKAYKSLRCRFVENSLTKLLNTIDNFGVCVKKMISYFNEMQFIQSSINESRLKEKAWNCIGSLKDVSTILFSATRFLEEYYPLKDIYAENYTIMENLNDCDYFTRDQSEYNAKNLKDFYNIFAYVQSQFLLRLSLTIYQDSSISYLRNEIDSLTHKINEFVRNEEQAFRRTIVVDRLRNRPDLSQLHQQAPHQNQSGTAAALKDTSLRLTSCLTAAADECESLEDKIRNFCQEYGKTQELPSASKVNDLLENINEIRNLETCISGCYDDVRRLMILYNKFLHSTLCVDIGSMEADGTDINIANENDDDDSLKLLQTVEELGEREPADDFYAHYFDENAIISCIGDHNSGDTFDNTQADFELSSLDRKETQRSFKPVLRQLKVKIDPIRENLLKKERQILTAKGVDVDRLIDSSDESFQRNSCISANNDSNSNSSDSECELSKSKKSKQSYFDEERNFMAQKPPINLFNIPLPLERLSTKEDILE